MPLIPQLPIVNIRRACKYLVPKDVGRGWIFGSGKEEWDPKHDLDVIIDLPPTEENKAKFQDCHESGIDLFLKDEAGHLFSVLLDDYLYEDDGTPVTFEGVHPWVFHCTKAIGVPHKKTEEEVRVYAKMLGERLMYPFYKWQAEKHGFYGVDAVPRYLKWREEEDRRKNKFQGFYVGERDQKMIQSHIASYRPEEWRGLDAIDAVLLEYGYDFADYQPNRNYVWHPQLKKWICGSSARPVSRAEVAAIPEEERDFPSGNYSYDRSIVQAVLYRHGWRYNPTRKWWEPSGKRKGPIYWRGKPSKCMYCGAICEWPEAPIERCPLVYIGSGRNISGEIQDYYRCQKCMKVTP
ncbi:MAG: hypothetical protein ACE5L6_01950, partial [Candidatus Bathyarchaeia archaeon]